MRDNQFKITVPTIGLNIETLTHKRYNFTFWDVGGQATKLWKHYFDKIDAVVFVIDSTDEEILLFAKDEFKRLLKDESLSTIPFLLLFNKCDDALNAKSNEELSARLELDKAKEEREIAISRCSAKMGEGIWEGIDLLIDIFDRRKNGAHLFPL
jgi:GTPase SAR1 family protein